MDEAPGGQEGKGNDLDSNVGGLVRGLSFPGRLGERCSRQGECPYEKPGPNLSAAGGPGCTWGGRADEGGSFLKMSSNRMSLNDRDITP